MSGQVSVRLLKPDAYLGAIHQARCDAGYLVGYIEVHGEKWTPDELLNLTQRAIRIADNLGLALNHQRAVERRAAKRTTK